MGTRSFKEEGVVNSDSDTVGIYFMDLERWSGRIFRRERLLLICIQQGRLPGRGGVGDMLSPISPLSYFP